MERRKLVGADWNHGMDYDFPLGIVTRTDELTFFRGVGIPPTGKTGRVFREKTGGFGEFYWVKMASFLLIEVLRGAFLGKTGFW